MALLDIHRQLATIFDDIGLPATDSVATAGNMSLGDQLIRVTHEMRGLSKLVIDMRVTETMVIDILVTDTRDMTRLYNTGLTIDLLRSRTQKKHLGFMTVTSKCLCLLLLLMVPPSRSWLLGPKKCSDKQYYVGKHICCLGELYVRPGIWTYPSCCGTELFNGGTHICCRRSNPKSAVETRVTEKVVGEKVSAICSGVWNTS
ncbi:hypothetical protein LSAT2_014394 [Lamellibrachia satsuma]|nr:hypothetical protein LSAT2_014394 [Lamellibrachia satsuma]